MMEKWTHGIRISIHMSFSSIVQYRIKMISIMISCSCLYYYSHDMAVELKAMGSEGLDVMNSLHKDSPELRSFCIFDAEHL